MYVATVYTATVSQTLELARYCSACNRNVPAKVSAVAIGQAEAPFMVGDAAATAAENADAQLGSIAHHLLHLAKCPHCEARDRSARGAAYRQAIWDGVIDLKSALVMLFALGAVSVTVVGATEPRVGLEAAPLLVSIALCAIWALVIRFGVRASMRKQCDLADATVMWLVPGAVHVPVPEAPVIAQPVAANGWPFA